MKPAVGAFLANFQVWSKGFLEGRRQKIEKKGKAMKREELVIYIFGSRRRRKKGKIHLRERKRV